MKPSLLSLMAALIAVCFFSDSHAQCALHEISLEDRFHQSDLIVEGTILDKQGFLDEELNVINSQNIIEVHKVFKGAISGKEVMMISPGGTLDNRGENVHPSISTTEGSYAIFFLNETSTGAYKPFAGPQGAIYIDEISLMATDAFNEYESVERDVYPMLESLSGAPKIIKSKSRRGVAKNTSATPIITDIFPKEVKAGTEFELTITGENFEDVRSVGMVQFRNASSGDPFVTPDATQYLIWSDTLIKVHVPSGAGSGIVRVVQDGFAFSDPITILYAQLNFISNTAVYKLAHVDMNGDGGMDWRLQFAFDNNTAAKNSFLWAMDEWTNATCINWVEGARTSRDVASRDGNNIIRFAATNELPTGVLAVTRSYSNFCGNNTFFVDEVDMSYDPDQNWNFGSSNPGALEFDIRSVSIHELGHAHQLGHVIDQNDFMHASIDEGDIKRDLGPNNIEAGIFVNFQSIEQNVCGPGPFVLPNGCTIPVGTNELETASSLQIFPNPANEFISIQVSGDQSIDRIEAFGPKGDVIYSERPTSSLISVDTRSWESGLYFFRILSDDQITTEKIVIQ